MADQVERIGAVQQRFSRNAADVDADAAQLLLLDDRRREAELRSPNGCDVTGGAAAEHDDIKGGHSYLESQG